MYFVPYFIIGLLHFWSTCSIRPDQIDDRCTVQYSTIDRFTVHACTHLSPSLTETLSRLSERGKIGETLAYNMYSIRLKEDISESSSELEGSHDGDLQEEFGRIYSSNLPCPQAGCL